MKLELLHATAGLAAASPAGVAPLRVCMRNVLTGGVAEADGVPLMAEKLLDAQLFYCTDDMTGEDLLGDAWWDLMYKTTAVSQSTEYSDGVGGATGSGSVRYTASFPIQWLRQEMAPLAYPGKSSGQTKLVDCMIQDVALFDPNPEEDLTIAIDLAHAECLNVEDGMSTRQYDRVLRALRLHHNVTTGSAITDRQASNRPYPMRATHPSAAAAVAMSSLSSNVAPLSSVRRLDNRRPRASRPSLSAHLFPFIAS